MTNKIVITPVRFWTKAWSHLGEVILQKAKGTKKRFILILKKPFEEIRCRDSQVSENVRYKGRELETPTKLVGKQVLDRWQNPL